MNYRRYSSYLGFLSVLAICICNYSCVNTKKARYFNTLTDTTINANMHLPESVIQKNDLLSITVSSLNPEASSVFNSPNSGNNNSPNLTGGTSSPGNAPALGYLVSSDGTIQFPILGTIKAESLTKAQLSAYITKSLIDKKLLIDPIVNIRFLNFRVTVIGEVKNPTVISVPNEKISLLEAIGLAGDLTLYAKRDNVLIIREDGNQKRIKRLNLNSNELFTSPYYYLQTNDVIYVEPNKAQIVNSSRSQQWIPILFSALSVLAILSYRIK